MLYIGSRSISGLSYSVSTGITLVLSVYWNRIANCWRETLFHCMCCNYRGFCRGLGKPPFYRGAVLIWKIIRHHCLCGCIKVLIIVTDQYPCYFQVLRGERETVGTACWGHSPWLRMSVRDGAATMATNAGGGGGGGGPASPNDHDGRSYVLQIYPRLAAQSTTCCNLRWEKLYK